MRFRLIDQSQTRQREVDIEALPEVALEEITATPAHGIVELDVEQLINNLIEGKYRAIAKMLWVDKHPIGHVAKRTGRSRGEIKRIATITRAILQANAWRNE